MDVEFTVSLVELKRAFRRLSLRLPDESEMVDKLVIFDVRDKRLDIVTAGTSEGLSACACPGRGRIPLPVFSGIARSLLFYRGKTVHLALAAGVLRIDRTDFRHPSISILLCAG